MMKHMIYIYVKQTHTYIHTYIFDRIINKTKGTIKGSVLRAISSPLRDLDSSSIQQR